MNRSEIVNEIAMLEEKQGVMEAELKKFATELSAPSQVAIIARLVQTQHQIDEYEKMLDFIDFEEIVGDQFK